MRYVIVLNLPPQPPKSATEAALRLLEKAGATEIHAPIIHHLPVLSAELNEEVRERLSRLPLIFSVAPEFAPANTE